MAEKFLENQNTPKRGCDSTRSFFPKAYFSALAKVRRALVLSRTFTPSMRLVWRLTMNFRFVAILE
jgi:hypothetical protein